MRCIVVLRQNSILAISLLCLPTLRQKLVGKVLLFIFRQNHHVLPELVCLRRAACLFFFSFPRMQILGITLELDPKGAKITCPAFGLYSSPVEHSTMEHVVLDLSSHAYQPRSRERSPRPTKRLNENQHIQLVPKNWMTTKMTNLLVVQIAQPFLQRKMKMINLLCNLLPKKKRRNVNLLQYAEFLHRYEEEKDCHSGEIRLPHWNKMCQETRVSDQKTSRVWEKFRW